VLTVPGGRAEFERDLIRARTGEGRERAKAHWVKIGRPQKLTPQRQREAIKAYRVGADALAEVGHSENVSAATISRLASGTEDRARKLPAALSRRLNTAGGGGWNKG
jgi:DNA invertase Pin-like site-specific DNA recombinase